MEREILHNKESTRFETSEDGFTGYLEYNLTNNRIDLVHTIVPKQIGGRGVAAELVRYALKYADENGLIVIATCDYVKEYIRRNKINPGI